MNKSVFVFLLFVIFSNLLPAQQRNFNQIILDEGVHLYNLEKIAWNSADFIYEYADMGILRGYLAYKEGNVYKCIYWNGAYDNLEVIHSFTSTNPDSPDDIQNDPRPRKLTEREQMLYDTKMQVLLLIKSDPAFFTAPDGVRLNALFIEDKDRVKVYVVSGVDREHKIPLGNDYLLVFSKTAQLLSKQKIHKEYLEISTEVDPDENGTITTFHRSTDPRSPYITPTDICNLLLYSDKKTVHHHTVFSDKYVSFFILGDKSLAIESVD